VLKQVWSTLSGRGRFKFTQPAIESLFIFLGCAVIYLANGQTIGSGDTLTNTLLGFNLLEHHTLSLEPFRGSYFYREPNPSYAFIAANNGQLSSVYPIGPALVSFPLYIIFYAFLKVMHWQTGTPLDITAASFEVWRALFEKLAATITTAISVVIFYWAGRLKFDRRVAGLSTFVFAFATSTWSTSSQGLWQHGSANLALVSILFCLLKANQVPAKSQGLWLLWAGVAAGLLPGIRPSSILFTLIVLIYVGVTFRRRTVFLVLGLVSALPSLAWNLYFFGNLLSGGYDKFVAHSGPMYRFTGQQFSQSFLGTLISPSRGLWVFSPIVLYALPGVRQVWRSRVQKDSRLIGCLMIAAGLVFTSFCFFSVWWAGHSYGPRYMTDTLPIICFCLNYPLAQQGSKLGRTATKNWFGVLSPLFWVALTYSVFVQWVGVFGVYPGNLHNGVPLNVDHHIDRLWSLKDSQIERYTKAVFHQFFPPPVKEVDYIQGLNGIINAVTDESRQPIGSVLSVQPGEQKILRLALQNTGKSQWFGYRSALRIGEVQVRGQFLNAQRQPVQEVRLYVAGAPKTTQTVNAIGAIKFPEKPGWYKLGFDLILQGWGDFPNHEPQSVYLLDVNVGNQRPTTRPPAPVFGQDIKLIESLHSTSAGAPLKVLLKVKNTSNFPWSQGDYQPTHLSYRWLNVQGKRIVAEGSRIKLPVDLPPGESAALTAIVETPRKPGKYQLVLTMVQEGVAWFDDQQAPPQLVDVELIAPKQ
jgi:hypothetical protein